MRLPGRLGLRILTGRIFDTDENRQPLETSRRGVFAIGDGLGMRRCLSLRKIFSFSPFWGSGRGVG
jgi:hypothetical protein